MSSSSRRRAAAPRRDRPAARTTIAVQGARVHNLKNISVEIPRDRLVVVTGLSGSGKSSLAFDTIYAEGQRRYLESLSSFAKRFVAQVSKPDVDFVFGLSPVISIEQKNVGSNPRSTVGTMTDIASYLNLLFATIAEPHCPRTGEPAPSRSASQILEAILSLPEGAADRASRTGVQGLRRGAGLRLHRSAEEGLPHADRGRAGAGPLPQETELEASDVEHMDAVVDRFVVEPEAREGDQGGDRGDAARRRRADAGPRRERRDARREAEQFYQGISSADPSLRLRRHRPGLLRLQQSRERVPHLRRARRRQAHASGTARSRSEAQHPRRLLRARGVQVQPRHVGRPDDVQPVAARSAFRSTRRGSSCRRKRSSAILYGIEPRRSCCARRPTPRSGATSGRAREVGFGGIARRIERHYRRYRQRGEANSRMEAWLDKVMVEHTCPDCKGARLRATRLLFTIGGKTLYDVGQLNFDELHAFLGTVKPAGRGADAGRQVLKEIRGRLELLLGIGLDYLNFNRRSGTLSGGESQRIRLSTQIGSGLMGMLYVLDEPSIGLHPKDNVKMIATLERLRDIGNTVIVVEHDEDTIRAADHLVEMGPGPGVHGGRVVVQGTLARRARRARRRRPGSSSRAGARSPRRRSAARATARSLVGARRAREQPQVDRRERFRSASLIAITGASGSGKSTLVNEILYKALWKHLVDTRTLPGEHDGVDGIEHVHKVVNIDQTPIGRNSRSNPATYVGFYDTIRDLFTRGAALDRARLQARAIQLQRQGRTLRGVPGRRRDHDAALLHARRRGHLRRVQGRALQQRDARGHAARQDDRRRAEHVGRGGRRRSSRASRRSGKQDRGARTISASAT